MKTTRQHIMDQAGLRCGGRRFLLPQVETIQDFVDEAFVLAPVRGSKREAPPENAFFIEHLPGWERVYIRADRNHGRAVRSQCCENRIGGYRVIKGAWPDPYALLLANDDLHIASPWISLIDWQGYRDWLEALDAERIPGYLTRQSG